MERRTCPAAALTRLVTELGARVSTSAERTVVRPSLLALKATPGPVAHAGPELVVAHTTRVRTL